VQVSFIVRPLSHKGDSLVTRLLMLVVAVVFVVGNLTSAAPAPAARPDNQGPDFLPLAEGAKWEYRRTFEGQAGLKVKSLDVRVSEVAKGEGGGVQFTGDFESLGLEERMVSAPEGVSYRGGLGRGDKPLALIRNSGKAGDQWTSLLPIGCGGFATATAKASGPEEVEVPAGKFRAVKVTYTAVVWGNRRTMLVWYADGVGVVKQVYCPDSANIVIELVKHTPGK